MLLEELSTQTQLPAVMFPWGPIIEPPRWVKANASQLVGRGESDLTEWQSEELRER